MPGGATPSQALPPTPAPGITPNLPGPAPALEAPKLPTGGPALGGTAPGPALSSGPKPALEAPKSAPSGPGIPPPGGPSPMGTSAPGAPAGVPVGVPGPMGGLPSGATALASGGSKEKKAGPSVFFMVLDFLVFGGALTLAILLYLQYS
jgi:translation initiation factor IF-2